MVLCYIAADGVMRTTGQTMKLVISLVQRTVEIRHTTYGVGDDTTSRLLGCMHAVRRRYGEHAILILLLIVNTTAMSLVPGKKYKLCDLIGRAYSTYSPPVLLLAGFPWCLRVDFYKSLKIRLPCKGVPQKHHATNSSAVSLFPSDSTQDAVLSSLCGCPSRRIMAMLGMPRKLR